MATQPAPQTVLVATASKLLASALGACLASSAAPGEHTVVLELQQSPETPAQLCLRVCDDGVPLAAEQHPLERWAVGLAPLLAQPQFAGRELLAQTTGLEEAVVRQYRLHAASGTGAVSLQQVGDSAKPPGSTLRGSVLELTLLLNHPPGVDGIAPDGGSTASAAQYVQQLLAAGGDSIQQQQQQRLSSDEVVASLEQLMGMVRVLAPPVQLLMSLHGVLLQAPDGSLQPTSGTRRMDLPLPAALDALGRFREGMAAEFLPPAAPDGGTGQLAEHGAEQQQPARQQGQGDPPLLTYLGMGEAGWGCTGAAQQFRGCKWTARAGLVLQLPDHAALRAAGQQEEGQADGSSHGRSVGQEPTSVYLFRSWEVQLGPEAQRQALKGVEKCDWGGHGFELVVARSTTDGPMEAVLHCAQPLSGARLAAAVVHLTPCEFRTQAEAGQLPGLAFSHEARLVRQALEAALRHLKQQCPAVLCSRRDRSLVRALPLISKSLANILLQSAGPAGGGAPAEQDEGSALHQGCSMVGCQPEELEQGISRLLQDAVAGASSGGAS